MIRKLKTIASLLMCAVMLLSFAGCGSDGGADKNLLDRANKLLQAEVRQYDKLFVGKMNETMSSQFFDFTITAAAMADELAGYSPEQDGYRFLVADVTVKNTFGEAIPVGNYDFAILWNGGADYAYTSFFDEMYPDDSELPDGETLSGKLVFELPADSTDIMITYDEIYDDDFKGNTYAVTIDL